MQAELKVLDGKQQGKSIPLNMKKFLIGREEDCHLRASSDLISRHHCVFSIDEYTVRLRDLGSTNGTFVNGERISGQIVLNDGDRVQIGKLLFQVVIRQGAPVTKGAPAEVISTVGEPGKPISLSDSAILPSSQTQEIPIPAEVAAQTQTGVFSGDTKVIGPGQPTPPLGVPETPAPYVPAPGYVMQPGYQMPVAYMPPAYPAPGYPAGYGVPGYPQPAPFPVPVAPYPMPGYGAPVVPTAPQPTASGLPDVTLPPPEETGAKPVVPTPTAENKDGAQAEPKKPSQLAADIIRQQLQRRPT